MAKKNSRVTKYPGNINNINIGMIFFSVMAIYIVISVITYMRRDHIVGYQVKEGALSTNNIYDAVAVRTEKIITSDNAGYVNYFATEGGRVAVGNLVYTVDESGQLLEYLKSQGSEEVALGDEDLSELRSQIVNFDSSFDPQNFYTVYDFKVSIDGTVQKLSNSSILQNIQSLNSSSGTLSSIGYKNAPDTGIVVYSIDGYEDLTLETMTLDKLDQKNYEKTQLINNTLVKAGDPVYKLCTSEEWSIIINEQDPERLQEFEELEYIKVRFIKNQDESWGKVTTYTNVDGQSFVQLTFTNSMITFCRDRFLNVELITEDETGLKIPNSSIVNKSFFLIPKAYLISNNDNTSGVLREKYDEQGNATTEFVSLNVYNETDTEYYIDTDTLRAGDTLIKPDSNERYTVSKTDTLIGVYNINKGYADFRQVKILYQNDEYAIVRSNTMYGLNVYDYIVLDSSTVDENSGNADEASDSSGDESEGIDESSYESSSDDNSAQDSSDTAAYEDSAASSSESSDEVSEESTEESTEDASDDSSGAVSSQV
ncbi:HlyD family efflux transporter periplasmic adaptor subunit [Butyrivibrio sp. AE2015]|uniref:HlyD family efflux transporter periplasmic adaptor subunit n=1 Tax=Butyrivibrio sp. AE2015 TaxID=1280663 RepID=UPI0003B6B925|nr:HlyD family efflux transporter periplasmic adaptor subunit [Butyrivibrio sp. AE2015]